MEPTGVAVRRAEPGDASAVAALERTSFSDPWSEETLRGEIDLSQSLVLVAQASPFSPVDGYAVWRRGYQEAELLRIGVRPARRRGGIARSLLDRGLADLGHEGLSLFHLEVRANNLPALALYERLGFVRVGFRPAYYRDGTDAILMSLELTASGVAGPATGAP